MAATPIDPTKLHNFELPQFWGDNASASSTVNRRSRFYKPTATSTTSPPSAAPPQSPPIPRDSSKSPCVEEFFRQTSTNSSNPPINMINNEAHQQSHKYNLGAEMNDDDPRLCQLRPHRRRKLIKKSSADKTRGEEGGEDKSRKPLESKNKATGTPIYTENREIDGSCGEINKENEKQKEMDIKNKFKDKGKGKMLEDPKEEVVVKGGGAEKKKKLSITIPLTKQEIEEDIFSLTGANPSKRPFKKHAKNVQMNLNARFPGLCLSSITPDTYKVAGPSRKKRKRY